MDKQRLLTDLENVKKGRIEENLPYDLIENAIARVSNSTNENEAIQALVENDLAFFAAAVSNEVYKESNGTSN